MTIYETFIPLDLEEIFNNRSLDEVIKKLSEISNKYHGNNISFATAKSETGIGSVVFINTESTSEYISSEKIQKIIDLDKKEWNKIREKFVKNNK